MNQLYEVTLIEGDDENTTYTTTSIEATSEEDAIEKAKDFVTDYGYYINRKELKVVSVKKNFFCSRFLV